jgi:hypothetical protein
MSTQPASKEIRMQRARSPWLLGAALTLLSCSDDKPGPDPDRWGADAGAGSSADAGAGEGRRDDASAPEAREVVVQDAALVGAIDAGACAVASTEVGLLPVHLAFAFDVSGSMGKGDKRWHNKMLKWDPVVRATRGFFEDPASSGLSASLTFFPAAGGEGPRCKAESYGEPDVPMTALPSSAFYGAIQAIELESTMEDWRGGTPTLFVVQGTRAYLKRQAETQRAKFAIVLITGGYPQDCDDDSDTVDAVVREAEAAAREGVPTYVVGVANPPLEGAPDTVSDLARIAVAGQTKQAYVIATGNESSTFSAFRAAVSAIREAAVSCEVAIPPAQPGRTFDKRKVAVLVKGDAADETLQYDASCAAPNAWRYDDPADPQRIALCPSTCERVQSAAKLRIEVQFACENLVLL